MGRADFLKFDGDYNAICDRCGFKFKATEMKEEWNGLYVCKECYEPRHPQDFLRGIPDDPSVAWTRPDTDADTNTTDVDGNALVTNNANDTVGDVDKTITSTDTATQIWDTTLTADRTATLSASYTNTWGIGTGSYSNKSFDISNETTIVSGIFVSSDGTKLYVLDKSNTEIYQYSLSVEWDISTAIYDMLSFSVSSESAVPTDITFSSDGTRVYIVDSTNNDVYQYNLTTAWDLSTISYSNNDLSINAEDTTAVGVDISSDGTKLYMLGRTNDTVFQYTLSTAYDLSTAIYASKFADVSSEMGTPEAVRFSSDGLKMFVLSDDLDAVLQYSLSIAWDVSTTSYDSISLDISSEEPTGSTALTFDSVGARLYMAGFNTDTVFQYAVGTLDSVDTSVWPFDGTVISIHRTATGAFDLIIRAENSTFDYTTLKTTGIPSISTFKFNASSWVFVSCTPTGL